jgi:polar amino acid transport system substrate-binding protein
MSTFTRGLAVAAAVLALAAPASARTVGEIQRSGELVMLGFLGANEVFLRAKPGGGYDGIDYELVAGFARTLGVRVRVVIKPNFADLIPALLAGEGDLIATTMSITAERERQVDFTRPYFPVLAMVLTRKGSGLSGLGSVAGKRGGVPPGTTLAQRAASLGFAETVFANWGPEQTRNALRAGDVDVVLIESTVALPLLAEDPSIELVGTLPGMEQYGFAVPPGSDLRAALDEFLGGARKGRSFYQLVLRYLGERGVEVLRVSEGQPAGR